LISDFRTGIGLDVHPFAEGRKLILGGIEIPYDRGLEGYSDADAITHSITDAVLGSLALNDIGTHFPDTDAQYKDADSSIFLKQAKELVLMRGYEINNVDVSVALQKPKLAPYVFDMRKRISEIIDIHIDRISIKATTTEKLGFIGREEGIAVVSIVTVIKKV